jgi:hypothetical protein
MFIKLTNLDEEVKEKRGREVGDRGKDKERLKIYANRIDPY